MRRESYGVVVALFVFSLIGLRHMVHDSLKYVHGDNILFPPLFSSYLTEDSCLSMKKTNQLIPFNKIIVLYRENHREDTNTLYGQKFSFWELAKSKRETQLLTLSCLSVRPSTHTEDLGFNRKNFRVI
jgi:hypothetical protein